MRATRQPAGENHGSDLLLLHSLQLGLQPGDGLQLLPGPPFRSRSPGPQVRLSKCAEEGTSGRRVELAQFRRISYGFCEGGRGQLSQVTGGGAGPKANQDGQSGHRRGTVPGPQRTAGQRWADQRLCDAGQVLPGLALPGLGGGQRLCRLLGAGLERIALQLTPKKKTQVCT